MLVADHDQLAPPGGRLPPMPSPEQPWTILALTANTRARTHLQTEEEIRDIGDGLRRARYRDHYRLLTCPAATFGGLMRALDDHEPALVHVGAHGSSAGALVLSEAKGGEHHVAPERFAELLALLPTRPWLVMFAVCHSAGLARMAARYARYAIGFDGEVGDDTALLLSAMLYDRLASRPEPDVVLAVSLARLMCVATGHEDGGLVRVFKGG